MNPRRHVLLIGGGLAAAKAAESLREEGFDGRVVMIAEEPERPYERPPLSKEFLLGTKPAEDIYVHPPEFYESQDIDLVTGDAAIRIDRSTGHVELRSGRRLRFDRLLIATGASPRSLDPDREPPEGVLALRTLQDSRALADRLRRVEHVTVVGAGWIGCEVAAAARSLDVDVTMVDPAPVPLARAMGPVIGATFRDLHVQHGVDVRLGVGVSGVAGAGQVEQVRLSDGRCIATPLVVIGVGAVPRTALAADAGLAVDDGVVVDQTLTTTDPRILAAGDVANAWHPRLGRHLRVEHWANALNQGITAGRNLLDAGQVYDRLPYFFGDQYDVGIEYVGQAADGDELVVRGALESRKFVAFWLRDGRVVAAMHANEWGVIEDLKALITSARRVDHARLADPDTPISELATA